MCALKSLPEITPKQKTDAEGGASKDKVKELNWTKASEASSGSTGIKKSNVI
jgi:hypothetical protein